LFEPFRFWHREGKVQHVCRKPSQDMTDILGLRRMTTLTSCLLYSPWRRTNLWTKSKTTFPCLDDEKQRKTATENCLHLNITVSWDEAKRILVFFFQHQLLYFNLYIL
jgi:hypothetical protein